MQLHLRPFAVKTAVISFFAVGLIGLINGISPATCCKRALIGSILVYLFTGIALKIIRFVVLSAIDTNPANQQQEKELSSEN